MHYIDLSNKKVFKDCGQFRYYVGSFCNAQELQDILNDEIHCFRGFKNPRSCKHVIQNFVRRTLEKVVF